MGERKSKRRARQRAAKDRRLASGLNGEVTSQTVIMDSGEFADVIERRGGLENKLPEGGIIRSANRADPVYCGDSTRVRKALAPRFMGYGSGDSALAQHEEIAELWGRKQRSKVGQNARMEAEKRNALDTKALRWVQDEPDPEIGHNARWLLMGSGVWRDTDSYHGIIVAAKLSDGKWRAVLESWDGTYIGNDEEMIRCGVDFVPLYQATRAQPEPVFHSLDELKDQVRLDIEAGKVATVKPREGIKAYKKRVSKKRGVIWKS